MTEEKTLGNILYEALYERYDGIEYYNHSANEKAGRWEKAAQAVIAEFLRRSGELVAIVERDRYGQSAAVLRRELPIGTELFLARQPSEVKVNV